VSQLTCSPTSLGSGGTSSCTVTLSQAAGSAGIALALSSNTAMLSVPSSVTVASGATSANFTATAGTISAAQTAVVTASYNGSSQTASISLSAAVSVSMLSCGSASLYSSWTASCTVTLSQPAGSGGVTVALSSNTTMLTVPASVSVPSGSTVASFTAVAGTVAANQTAVVSASYNGSSRTASLSLLAASSISSLSCTPTSVNSGGSSSCTLVLANAAGSGGVPVTLSSSTAALAVPATVTVPGGSTMTTFTATAGTVSANQSAVITATYNGSSQTVTVNVVAMTSLSSLSCTPASISSGGTAACTVTLFGTAGSGGLVVTLSSNASALSVPATVTIASGSSLANFTASAGTVTTAQTAVVTASANGTSETVSISLQTGYSLEKGPALGCTRDPNTAGRLNCTVGLPAAAPTGGAAVILASNTSRVQVPAQLQVPAGGLSTSFAATVTSSDQDVNAQITVSGAGGSTTVIIPIQGIRPTSLNCTPQSIQAGETFTCTVGMNTPNVLQVALLSVTSDNAAFQLPSTFATRPGQSQLDFLVSSTPFAGPQSSAVTVEFGQTAVTANVAVTPAAAPVLTLPGTQLAAYGRPLTFTVSAADPAGLPFTLSASNLPAGASFYAAKGQFLWIPQAAPGAGSATRAQSTVERRMINFTVTDSAMKSTTGSVAIEVDSGLPVITGLRNAASQQSQPAIAKAALPSAAASPGCTAGSVASLLGRWLASGASPVSDPTGGSTQLGGTEVIVNGNAVPVVYASSTRVDFVCPEAVAGQLEIAVHSGSQASNLIQARQEPTLGLFSADGTGLGQGMVTLSGTSLLATPRSYLNAGQPAEPGDSISILATGDGLDSNPSGVQISIGGIPTAAAQVQAMPGMAGVYQITVTVPNSVTPGDAVPVVARVTGSNGRALTSNAVTMAIEPL